MSTKAKAVLFIIAGLVPTSDEQAVIFGKVEAGENVTVESGHKINPEAPPAMDAYDEIGGDVPKPWSDAFEASQAAKREAATAIAEDKPAMESPFAEVGRKRNKG
jgi:hypothetical protein